MTWIATNWKLGTVKRKNEQKKSRRVKAGFLKSLIYKGFFGGVDGTRTRDPRRDRPVF